MAHADYRRPVHQATTSATWLMRGVTDVTGGGGRAAYACRSGDDSAQVTAGQRGEFGAVGDVELGVDV